MALDVYLDINPGMNRTGCPLDNALRRPLDPCRSRRALQRRLHALAMGTPGGLLKEHQGDRRKLDAALFPLYDRLLEIEQPPSARPARSSRPGRRRCSRASRTRASRRRAATASRPAPLCSETCVRSMNAPWVWNRPRSS